MFLYQWTVVVSKQQLKSLTNEQWYNFKAKRNKNAIKWARAAHHIYNTKIGHFSSQAAIATPYSYTIQTKLTQKHIIIIKKGANTKT